MKWVNDVMLGNKKIAGILTESECVGQRLTVLLGIGVNIDSAPLESSSSIEKEVNPHYI
jgi:BirA family biotin operon repressor/biotin-[acetyl-CoA-carboxylase] ligase